MPGHTAADAAPVAGSDRGHKRRWGILADPSASLGGLVHRPEYRRGGARRVAARRRPGLAPFAAGLIAAPIFALFPVAPPRLAGVGISDSVSSHAAVALTGPSTIFYNPYAAVPSLHVRLAFAVGFAAAAALRARWARGLALSWGPLVTLSVLAT